MRLLELGLRPLGNLGPALAATILVWGLASLPVSDGLAQCPEHEFRPKIPTIRTPAQNPKGWADGVALTKVPHQKNKDARVVEVDVTASVSEVQLLDGTKTVVWTYNNSFGGALIEANVGDTLIMNFTNNLPEATTVHFHGVELPADQDGSNISQDPIEPGASRQYKFPLLNAATHWFHPHKNSNEQVERGLYGALVIRDPRRDQELGLPNDEVFLIFDDIRLGADNQVVEGFGDDPVTRAKTLLNGREGDTLLVNGRVNPTINIQSGAPQRWRVLNASNSRFLRLSVPGAKVYRIGGDGGLLQTPVEVRPILQVDPPPMDMPGMGGGHSMPGMTPPATGTTPPMTGMPPDGMNPMPGMPMPAMHMKVSDPDPNVGVFLTPGERADLIIIPTGEVGKDLAVEWHDFPRGRHDVVQEDGQDGTPGGLVMKHGHMDGKHRPKTAMTLHVAEAADTRAAAFKLPEQLREIEPIDLSNVAATIPVIFGHMPPTPDGNVVFFAQMKDGKPLPFKKVTAADAPVVHVGDTVVFEVHNKTMGDHPFHLHGFFFQELETVYKDVDGSVTMRVPAARLENKDTVRVPKRMGPKGSEAIVRVAVKIDPEGRTGLVAHGKEPSEEDGTSGGWVYHCHILDHGAAGMMSFLQVKPRPEYSQKGK